MATDEQAGNGSGNVRGPAYTVQMTTELVDDASAVLSDWLRFGGAGVGAKFRPSGNIVEALAQRNRLFDVMEKWAREADDAER